MTLIGDFAEPEPWGVSWPRQVEPLWKRMLSPGWKATLFTFCSVRQAVPAEVPAPVSFPEEQST
jgi:hypothetical protein